MHDTRAKAAATTAHRPFKFVTNWCFASRGTETLIHLVRSWMETDPQGGCISDDLANMYNTTSRRCAFAFLRRRFPSLLPIFRFFYFVPAVIWFGGSTFHCIPGRDGAPSTLTSPDTPGAVPVCSRIGGVQGDGGASVMCIGGYHEALAHVQRAHPLVDIACTADDTYLHGPITPITPSPPPTPHLHPPHPSPPPMPPLFQCYADKRATARSQCGLESKLRKVKVLSPAGDLSFAPPDLPGSPNHTEPSLARPVHCFKVAGTPVGLPDACTPAITALVDARLAPIAHVLAMRDDTATTQSGHRISSARSLQSLLIRCVAAVIPNYWMRTAPPEQTEAASTLADDRVARALSHITQTSDSPPDRATLALDCMLHPSRHGGIGVTRHTITRTASYVASLYSAHAVCSRVYPTFTSLSFDTPTTPATLGFSRAYHHITSTLASLRTRFAVLDRTTRTWVDGTIHSAYHPSLPPSMVLPPITDLFTGAASDIAPRFTQRSLAAVLNTSSWLHTLERCRAFDAGNAGAITPHREAARFISCSQEGSGAWLRRVPDPSLPGTDIHSADMLTRLQRRFGLYVSALLPSLHGLSRRAVPPSQYDYLGDSVVNRGDPNARHNAAQRAIYTALSSASLPDRLQLGDKGDGTPAARDEAKRRYAHLNAHHIPDIIRYSQPTTLYEIKCFAVHTLQPALGHGSVTGGGAASAADGHFIAFGNTLERARTLVLGTAARGSPSDRPLDRTTGLGRVAATDGQYADAIRRGLYVLLLLIESTGAFSPDLTRLLRALAASASATHGADTTVYGASHASPRDFVSHHAAAISNAVVAAESALIRERAAHLDFADALPPPPPPSHAPPGPTPLTLGSYLTCPPRPPLPPPSAHTAP